MKTSNKLLLAALLFSNYFVFIFFISPHLFHRPAISSILFLIQVHSNPRHSCQPTSAETIQQMLSPSAHFPIQFTVNLPTTRKCFLTIMSFHVGVNFIIIRPIYTRTNISLVREKPEAEERRGGGARCQYSGTSTGRTRQQQKVAQMPRPLLNTHLITLIPSPSSVCLLYPSHVAQM